MAKTRLKRPTDPIALAKLIGDIATGQVVDEVDDGKNAAAVSLSKLGASKGGIARAKKLSVERKKAIAKGAAAKRWSKIPKKSNEASSGSVSTQKKKVLIVPQE